MKKQLSVNAVIRDVEWLSFWREDNETLCDFCLEVIPNRDRYI